VIDRILHHHGAGVWRNPGYVYDQQGCYIACLQPWSDAQAKKIALISHPGEFIAYFSTVALMAALCSAKVSEIDFSQAVVWLRS
jgi:hypothetical protein